MRKYVISYDEVYDVDFERNQQRVYLIRLANSNGYITSPKRIHANNFEEAYRFAMAKIKYFNFERIVSIEEEIN